MEGKTVATELMSNAQVVLPPNAEYFYSSRFVLKVIVSYNRRNKVTFKRR
jgi:hypothetical protein